MSCAKGKNFSFRHFRRPSWIFAENEKVSISRKTVRDRAISNEFLTRRVLQESLVQRREISIFATFGGHLGFLRKMKKCQYLETVRDRVILSEFLTCRVVQECPVERGKISIFATFGGHLGFSRKMKKCQYLKNRKR